MKRLHLILALAMSLAACRERGPEIDFGFGIKTSDTTYIASPETPQPRNVLIEDFTGVSCPPCPAGHQKLKAMLTQYPGRIVITGNHIFGFVQARPNHASRQDFRTQDATDISTAFGGIPFMPSAIIDRVPDGPGNFIQGSTVWATLVDNRINVPTPVNISITKTWDESRRTAQARIRLAYTQAVTARHSLTIAVIENEIIDAQETPTGIDTFYTHNDVLRDIVTLVGGVSVLDSIGTKAAGRVFERSIAIPIDAKWNADKCKIVAIVHYIDAADKSVLQAFETDIK